MTERLAGQQPVGGGVEGQDLQLVRSPPYSLGSVSWVWKHCSGASCQQRTISR